MDERIKSYIKENLSLEQLRDANQLSIPVFKDEIQKIIEELEAEQIHYVDLGLPSGTLWADRNVGAKKPQDFGGYFNFNDSQKQGTLPARWQMCELVDCTQHCIREVEGVKGMRFIGKNGNSIFMPLAGFIGPLLDNVGRSGYWWSCIHDGTYAFSLSLYNNGSIYPASSNTCARGFSVRLIQ